MMHFSDDTHHTRAWQPRIRPREQYCGSNATSTGRKRPYGPGLCGPLVLVAESGSITQDQCRSRFQHELGLIGLHVDALQREGAWVIGPGS
jgi:hypothetical protein